MPARFPGFPPEARQFLQDLKANNNRDWFLPRKPVYEESVKAPMTELVLALGEELLTGPDMRVRGIQPQRILEGMVYRYLDE